MRKAGVKDYEGAAKDILSVIPDRPISFEVFADDFAEMERQARRIATWHYQWIVRHDYLPRIIDPITSQKLPELEQAAHANSPQTSTLPVEFNVGAFRFGHSMVRDVYKTGVNDQHNRARLLDFLMQTGAMGGASPALPDPEGGSGE